MKSALEESQLRQTESPANGLPEGWLPTKLGTVCDINPPKPPKDALPPDAPVTFVPMPAVDEEKGAITAPQSRPFAEVRKGYTAFHDDDVIMAKITPCMENGKAAIARGLMNGLGFGSTEFHVLRSIGAVLPEFVYHFIRQESFRRDAESEMTGSVGQKRVPQAFIDEAELPLPPLAEQKRIAAKVEELLARVNAAREHLKRVPVILERFRQAVLAAACSGRLTADWRAEASGLRPASEALEVFLSKIKGHRGRRVPPVIEEPSELDENWAWASLDQVAALEPRSITDGPFGSNLKTEHYTLNGPRVIRLQNIGDCFFVDSRAHISHEHYSRLAKHRILAGDVAIGTLGDPIPRACVIPECVGPAIVKADCIRFKPNPELADSNFICYVLNDQVTRHRMTEVIHGVGRARLNLQQVKSIPIPLPPVKEQREVVRRVEALFKLADAIERRVAAVTARADKLTQAILAKAFRGELVPTEAELARRENRPYEPASVLLERIRSERATTNPAPKRRKAKRAEVSDA